MLSIGDDRWPAVQKYRWCFETAHLPEGKPRELMQAYAGMAQALVDLLPDDPWLVAALHDLWESKNAAVFMGVRLEKGWT